MFRRIWTWLKDEHNRGALALIIAIVIGGPWAMFTFFYDSAPEPQSEAEQGQVVAEVAPGLAAIAGVWDSGTRVYDGVSFRVQNDLAADGTFYWTARGNGAELWVRGTWKVEGNEIVSENTATSYAGFPLNRPIYTKFELLGPRSMRYRDPINFDWVTAARVD